MCFPQLQKHDQSIDLMVVSYTRAGNRIWDVTWRFSKSWRYPQIIQVIRPWLGIETHGDVGDHPLKKTRWCYENLPVMEVSWNRGTPQSSISMGFSVKNHPFSGSPFMEPPKWTLRTAPSPGNPSEFGTAQLSPCSLACYDTTRSPGASWGLEWREILHQLIDGLSHDL